jgi:hypothetical protein
LTDLNVTFQTASYLIAALSFAVTCAYYIMNLNNNKKNQELALKTQQQSLETRQAQLFMNIYQFMMTKDFLDSEYLLYQVKLEKSEDWDTLQKDVDKYRAFNVYATLFEGLGVLLKEGMLDVRLPAQMMSGPIIWFWDRYCKGILDLRVKRNWPKYGTEVEFLADRVREYGRVHPELMITSPEIAK